MFRFTKILIVMTLLGALGLYLMHTYHSPININPQMKKYALFMGGLVALFLIFPAPLTTHTGIAMTEQGMREALRYGYLGEVTVYQTIFSIPNHPTDLSPYAYLVLPSGQLLHKRNGNAIAATSQWGHKVRWFDGKAIMVMWIRSGGEHSYDFVYVFDGSDRELIRHAARGSQFESKQPKWFVALDNDAERAGGLHKLMSVV